MKAILLPDGIIHPHALYGLGEYDNLAAAVEEIVQIRDVYYPDPDSEKIYGESLLSNCLSH